MHPPTPRDLVLFKTSSDRVRTFGHFLLWQLGIRDPETQTSPEERDCLERYVAGRKRVVEIGVWHGVTTARLRRSMDAAGTLFAVDPFPRGRLGFSIQRVIATHTVNATDGGSVQWVRRMGHDAAAGILASGPIDFLFVDGDHSWEGISRDWSAWSGGVGEGGLVALHDSVATPARKIESAGSVMFVAEVVARDPHFRRVETVDSLTVWERLAAG